jgi:hypothetical protein
MLQESRIEEESQVTLTGLLGTARVTGMDTQVGGQTGLLGTVGVTGMDTRVVGQTGLLRTAGVTRTMTWVGKHTRLLRTVGVTGTSAQVSMRIGLLSSAGVTETATRSREILSGLPKIRLPRKAGVRRSWLTENWVLEKVANTESWDMENLANTENQVMQDLGIRKLEEGKGAAPCKRPPRQWCQRGFTKTQKCRLQKMRQ